MTVSANQCLFLYSYSPRKCKHKWIISAKIVCSTYGKIITFILNSDQMKFSTFKVTSKKADFVSKCYVYKKLRVDNIGSLY